MKWRRRNKGADFVSVHNYYEHVIRPLSIEAVFVVEEIFADKAVDLLHHDRPHLQAAERFAVVTNGVVVPTGLDVYKG